MSDNQKSVRPQFQKFPRLRESAAAQRPSTTGNPSIFSPEGTNNYKTFIKPVVKPYKPRAKNWEEAFKVWILRNPGKFQISVLTIGLTIFYSKPIYDVFFNPAPREIVDVEKLIALRKAEADASTKS